MQLTLKASATQSYGGTNREDGAVAQAMLFARDEVTRRPDKVLSRRVYARTRARCGGNLPGTAVTSILELIVPVLAMRRNSAALL